MIEKAKDLYELILRILSLPGKLTAICTMHIIKKLPVLYMIILRLYQIVSECTNFSDNSATLSDLLIVSNVDAIEFDNII